MSEYLDKGTPSAPASPPEGEEKEEPIQPPEGAGRGYETEREGVLSATEGGIPDPTVQPEGGTVTDPIPGAEPEAKPEG